MEAYQERADAIIQDVLRSRAKIHPKDKIVLTPELVPDFVTVIYHRLNDHFALVCPHSAEDVMQAILDALLPPPGAMIIREAKVWECSHDVIDALENAHLLEH